MKISFLKKSFFYLVTILSLTLFCSSLSAKIKKVEYTSQDLRDPFQNPYEITQTDQELQKGPMMETLSHLQVQGMVWDSEMPQAIINNKVVRVGEIIEGAQILDIRKEGVYVLYEQRKYILRPTISIDKERGGKKW